MSSQIAALVKKHNTSSSEACTGLRTVIMASADSARTDANTQKRTSTSNLDSPLTIGRVGGLVGVDQRVVAFTHCKQLVLAHDVLAAVLHVVLVDARQHDGVHRAGFLAEAAVDAFEEVDVVTRGAARAVLRNVRVDGDAHRRAYRLAQLAGDAAFFAVRITAQRVQPAEARRLRGLLFRVVHRELRTEECADGHAEALEELPEC